MSSRDDNRPNESTEWTIRGVAVLSRNRLKGAQRSTTFDSGEEKTASV